MANFKPFTSRGRTEQVRQSACRQSRLQKGTLPRGTLKLWQRAGLISDLREQVTFVLIPAQHDNDGNPIEKSVRYIADFVYTDNETGQMVVEDTKGVRTKEYIIKRKLMLYIHGIRIKEV